MGRSRVVIRRRSSGYGAVVWAAVVRREAIGLPGPERVGMSRVGVVAGAFDLARRMFDLPAVGHGRGHECEEGVGVLGAVDDVEVASGELVE